MASERVMGVAGLTFAATVILVHPHHELVVDDAQRFAPLTPTRLPEIETGEPNHQRLTEPLTIATSTGNKSVGLTGIEISSGAGFVSPSVTVGV